jgi:hypothetical protein
MRRTPPTTLAVEGWNATDLQSREVFQECLASLRAQTYPLEQCEVLVLLGDDVAPGEADRTLRGMPGGRAVRVEDATYYRMKNAAMREAAGAVLVFADSDMRYAPTWLERMLGSFHDGVDVVVGNTQYRPGFLSRTRGLCDWPATRPRSGFTDWIYGNNLALRESVYRWLTFREDMGRGGGGAADLARLALRRKGIRPWFCAEANGSHYLAPFWENRFRNGAYLIHHRRLDPGLAGARLLWIPLLGPWLVVGGTLLRAWRRAWRMRGTLPLRGLTFPGYWASILATKAVEAVGASFYAWAPALAARHPWLSNLNTGPVADT